MGHVCHCPHLFLFFFVAGSWQLEERALRRASDGRLIPAFPSGQNAAAMQQPDGSVCSCATSPESDTLPGNHAEAQPEYHLHKVIEEA